MLETTKHTSSSVWVLVAAGVCTSVIWQLPYGNLILYPFTLLATWFHEFAGHGITAMLVGFNLSRIKIDTDGSGAAQYKYFQFYENTRYFAFAESLISIAGPIAPIIWGCFLVCVSSLGYNSKITTTTSSSSSAILLPITTTLSSSTSSSTSAAVSLSSISRLRYYFLSNSFICRSVLFGFGCALLFSTFYYIRGSILGTICFSILGITFCCISLLVRQQHILAFILQFLGIQAIISVFHNVTYLFTREIESTPLPRSSSPASSLIRGISLLTPLLADDETSSIAQAVRLSDTGFLEKYSMVPYWVWGTLIITTAAIMSILSCCFVFRSLFLPCCCLFKHQYHQKQKVDHREEEDIGNYVSSKQ